MRVLYVGNFGAPHSTENHLRRALAANGHDVIAVQESAVCFQAVPRQASRHHADLVLWTHTHGLAPEATHGRQQRMLDQLRDLSVPTVGYHLDRWWGLDREHQVAEEPFFRCDLVCTADGGHDDLWAKAGVNHRWFPPGVLASECEPGRRREEYASPIVFVGSWQGGYHAEATHRHELIAWLRDNFAGKVRFWPKPGEHAVRGRDLCDLYASVDIAIGDSCLVREADGEWTRGYLSDRTPESLGRGACYLHPLVAGCIGTEPGDLWTAGLHLGAWEMGCWDELGETIEALLADPETRADLARNGRAFTLREHTYERRMVQLVDVMHAEGLL